MFRGNTYLRSVGVVLFILLGIVLGRVADIGIPAGAVAAEENARPLDAEYAKALAALEAALPANDPNLQRLVAVHAQLTRALTGRIEKIEAEHAMRQRTLQKEKHELEAKLQVAVKEAEQKGQMLEDKIAPIDLLAYDKPKGKVVTVDREQQLVQLNLGSADIVRPGLTFSVFSDGEYKPSAERKAAVVVVEVTGAHTCRARVTEMKNAVRRPIVAGDLLYNPAWIPGLRERVAVIGRIDLNGDGRDNTAAFVRALEKENVIVDAWIDLKDLSVKGARKAITLQTNFLIIGEVPDLEEDRAAQLSQDELEKLLVLRQRVSDLHHQARQKGVTIVNARRFMALVGMEVPRLDGESSKKQGDGKQQGR